jgi:toxin ParE1/3/4
MSDAREVVFSPAAANDLKTIAKFLDEAAGRAVALRWTAELRDMYELLAKTPGTLGRPRDELAAGMRSHVVSPYVLFFRVSDHELEAVRILHERQDVDSKFSDE